MIENIVGIIPTPQVSLKSGGRAAQASMLDVDFGEHTDIGKVREQNEDSHGHVAPANPAQARSHGWLFVLADGVGGHERGEVASRLAVDCVVEGFRESRAGEPHTALLPRLAEKANLRVYEAGRAAAPGGARMATTLVACALRYDRAVIAHVGDSRCYLIRRGRATLLTRDHTVANEHVRLGLISAERVGPILQSPYAAALAGKRPLRECRRQSDAGGSGRCAVALLRWIAWRFGSGRHGPHCHSESRICTRPRGSWWRLPMNGMAAIISAFRWFASRASNAWECTEGGLTSCGRT